MHVPILRTEYIQQQDSSVSFLNTAKGSTQEGGLGQRHVTQPQSWSYGVTMVLEASPALLHLTTAVSRIYLHRVTGMQSLGGLTR